MACSDQLDCYDTTPHMPRVHWVSENTGGPYSISLPIPTFGVKLLRMPMGGGNRLPPSDKSACLPYSIK